MRLAAIGLFVSLAAFGQAPMFEVASVKLIEGNSLPPGFSLSPIRSGGRWSWVTMLSEVVCYAYDIPAWALSGLQPGPPAYRIEATMNASATEPEVRAMLRSLLADRFHFAAHNKTEERSGFALVVSQKGQRLSRKTQDNELPQMPDFLAGKSPEAFEGKIFSSSEGRGTSAITGRGVPVSKLAAQISDAVHTVVLDRTGLSGDYYFGFKFLNEDPEGANARDLSVQSLPIGIALEAELGLRLEKIKTPVQILMVDHVDKTPSEN
jgi:uncharacterized protein (TIGR03435 family)